MPNFCKVEREGRLTIVTLNRPEVMNALHPPAHFELGEAFEVGAAAIVGVDNICRHVAGGRRSVEGRQNTRVVLIRIVVDVLARLGAWVRDASRRRAAFALEPDQRSVDGVIA